MSDWDIGSGSYNDANKFKKELHESHLIMATGIELVRDVETQFGKSDAARCTYLACIDDGWIGEGVMVWGEALVPWLTSPGPSIRAGRLGRAAAKPGRSGAWVVWDASDEDLALVRKFLDTYARRMGENGERAEIDVSAVREANPPAAANEPF